jgi:hypothetical protein
LTHISSFYEVEYLELFVGMFLVNPYTYHLCISEFPGFSFELFHEGAAKGCFPGVADRTVFVRVLYAYVMIQYLRHVCVFLQQVAAPIRRR